MNEWQLSMQNIWVDGWQMEDNIKICKYSVALKISLIILTKEAYYSN